MEAFQQIFKYLCPKILRDFLQKKEHTTASGFLIGNTNGYFLNLDFDYSDFKLEIDNHEKRLEILKNDLENKRYNIKFDFQDSSDNNKLIQFQQNVLKLNCKIKSFPYWNPKFKKENSYSNIIEE